MPKPFDTQTFTVGALLGRYERRQVILPTFQRSYSWEKVQVSAFINDLLQFQEEFVRSPSTASYFLGSIVLIEKDESLLLLDGQQRMATATIVLAAMRDLARSLDKPSFIKGSDLARDIQRELIEKDTDPVTFALILSELDEPFFHKAIKSDPPAVPNSKLRSHQLLQSAYNQSIQRLKEVIHAKSAEDAIRILKAIRDALSKGMTLIGITVENEDDAYTIFETLNDRGLRLSVPDLVLNLLMRRAPDGTSRGIVRQHWNSMLRELGKRDVSRFLRHLWVSRYGDLKSEGLFTAIKRELDFARIDSITFAEQCADECDDYVALLDGNIALPSPKGLRDLEGIVKYLQITAAPPLLLAAYRSLTLHDFEKLLTALIAIYVRYVVVTNQNPLDLESRVFESARIIRELAKQGKPSGKQLSAAKAKLKELSVPDSIVKSSADQVFLNRSEALWILTVLANDRQSKTKEVGMDRSNLEHIFPQNPLASGWPNAVDLEGYVWHLGNLTILGDKINRDAQNKGFKDKITLHYSKSEVEITKDLLKLSSWTPNDVINRAKSLTDQISKIWPAVK